MMPKGQDGRIFVAGHRGLVGSALVRRLMDGGYGNLLLRTREELDLLDQAAVDRFFAEQRPDVVFLAAARVGGIQANATRPADFLLENVLLQTNVLRAAWKSATRKLLFLGSSCIYPREAPQPMREEHLLTAPLEPSNEPYAVAKIAGIKLCRALHVQYGCDFLAAMPTNLYGPGDQFDLEGAHVLPALLRKIHEARERRAETVEIWGSGTPRREFLHCDDLADACVFLMENASAAEIGECINVGVGEDVSIRELAELICDVVGYSGDLTFDVTRPDGTPRKLLDVSRMTRLGWQARIALRDGIAATHAWYRAHGPER
jgi:GDP-L-fucose synthase